MKLIPKNLLVVAAAVACIAFSATTQNCHAGAWCDSLFGGRPPVYPVGVPVPVNSQMTAYSPGGYQPLGYVPPSYANLRSPQVLGYGNYASPPTNNGPLIAPGFPQTVFSHLPTAAYDSQWARTPVTYYRPVTAFDPRYGTTVTSLQPCTSYQYQALRQPVIAPRPLLGEYGMQANRWPSITGPGYNPTGLANTAMVPPLTTMPYNPAYVGQQAVGQQYPVQQSYYNGQNYNLQVGVNPLYASGLPSSPNVEWSNPTVGSGVIPSAAWMPSTAAGATSVTPVGPPTYSSTPNPTYMPGSSAPLNNSSTGIGPGSNAAMAPGNANPYANPNAAPPANGQVFPPNPVFPPNSNLYDPESTRIPGIGMGSNGASNATPKASSKPFDIQTLPMVAIDHQSSSRILNGTPEIPQTLAPSGSNVMQPLRAPDDFDSKPRWDPTLLDPEDRTVMERDSNVLAVAIETKQSHRNSIQLVSGMESKKPESDGSGVIRFRPVTTLK